MSYSKSYNKNTGITYVYEVLENKWDKEKKRAVNKRRLIGKIDPVTGEIVPTRKKKSAQSAAALESEPASCSEAVLFNEADPATASPAASLPDLSQILQQLEAMKETAASLQNQINQLCALVNDQISHS